MCSSERVDASRRDSDVPLTIAAGRQRAGRTEGRVKRTEVEGRGRRDGGVAQSDMCGTI